MYSLVQPGPVQMNAKLTGIDERQSSPKLNIFNLSSCFEIVVVSFGDVVGPWHFWITFPLTTSITKLDHR